MVLIWHFSPCWKIMYPKYSKHWPYPMASTMGRVCSKISNHNMLQFLGFLMSWVIFFQFQVCWVKMLSKLNWKFRFKIYNLLQFLGFLMYKLICKKPDNFYLPKMAVLSSFLQVFIVLGTYNFSPCCCCCPKMAINKQFPPRWMAERTFEAPKEKRLLVVRTRVLPSISMVVSLYHREMNLKEPQGTNTE